MAFVVLGGIVTLAFAQSGRATELGVCCGRDPRAADEQESTLQAPDALERKEIVAGRTYCHYGVLRACGLSKSCPLSEQTFIKHALDCVVANRLER